MDRNIEILIYDNVELITNLKIFLLMFLKNINFKKEFKIRYKYLMLLK